MNQTEKTAAELKYAGYTDIDCVELFIRNIEAREGMTRPSMRMIGHTTYLVFGRKVQRQKKEEAAEEEEVIEEEKEAPGEIKEEVEEMTTA
jgi:tRNA (adenine57-N1/adenine58-N1)-methyltransferase